MVFNIFKLDGFIQNFCHCLLYQDTGLGISLNTYLVFWYNNHCNREEKTIRVDQFTNSTDIACRVSQDGYCVKDLIAVSQIVCIY